jgi:NTP pyrophosphatase (non-canonical NTP hydrolase)
MAIYLCSVDPKAPENYTIGLKAQKWGVTEKYRAKIEPVTRGDTLIFLVEGHFRSIHRVESAPFEEDDLLWPPVEGDPYRFRIRISEPLFLGNVPAGEFAESIGWFKRFHGYLGLAVQGFKGVFNPALSNADLELIKGRMASASSSDPPASGKEGTCGRGGDSLTELRGLVNEFMQERDWEQFHTPKNLATALSVEAAELLEPFQWLTTGAELRDTKREQVRHEMADVLIYLICLADKLNIDLSAAVRDKLALNRAKYPPEKVRGDARKYDEYE